MFFFLQKYINFWSWKEPFFSKLCLTQDQASRFFASNNFEKGFGYS